MHINIYVYNSFATCLLYVAAFLAEGLGWGSGGLAHDPQAKGHMALRRPSKQASKQTRKQEGPKKGQWTEQYNRCIIPCLIFLFMRIYFYIDMSFFILHTEYYYMLDSVSYQFLIRVATLV